MSDQQLVIEVSVPPFPEGAEMSPSEFAAWLAANLVLKASGNALAGQVGGTQPTEDAGLYVDEVNRKIMVFNTGQYRSLLSVPIGCMLPFPSQSLVAPDPDYEFCDGQLLLKTLYPQLALVLGNTWTATGDDPAFFRLPNSQGRVPIGAGTGDYNPHKLAGVNNGVMTARVTGDYFGTEWLRYNVPTQPNAPTGRYAYTPAGSVANGYVSNTRSYNSVIPPAFGVRWLIRAQ